MKRMKLAAMAVLAGLALILVVATAMANSSSYAFTMNRRYVSGSKNKTFHNLDAGELTLSGKVWIHEKRAAAAPDPTAITIEVMKAGTVLDDVICSVVVTPSRVFNDKKDVSKSCGKIESDKYWIVVYKAKMGSEDGDGWHSQGSGTLTTR